MLLIDGYPQGSNLTLLNTIHYPSRAIKENGKVVGFSTEAIDLIIKDVDAGTKFLYTIENPTYEFYTVKEQYMHEFDQYGPKFYPHFVEREKCTMHKVENNRLKYKIADILGKSKQYSEIKKNVGLDYKTKNREIRQMTMTNPKILMADMTFEDNIRFQFSNAYRNDTTKISKSYLDIEADVLHTKGDFVEMGECPINAVSLIDDSTMEIHSFLLRNPMNPLIAEFEARANSIEMQNDIIGFIRSAIGHDDASCNRNAERYKVDQMRVFFHFYDLDREIDLIRDLFRRINNMKPDFVLAWNMAFDIPYIIERIKKLGYDPVDIMVPSDFKYRVAYYKVDDYHPEDTKESESEQKKKIAEMNQDIDGSELGEDGETQDEVKDIKRNEKKRSTYRSTKPAEERNDRAYISSYSVYLDQLIHFASRRKGQSALASYKLDYIGEVTCGVRKLDYSHITTDLKYLPYKDYKTFVFYNIMDTIVQYCIEANVNDIGSAYNDVLINNTRYDHIYRQTKYLKNRATKSYYNNGCIIGNNVNFNNVKEKFPGAFVSDPRLNTDYSKATLGGRPVMIFDNLNDFDYKSLYPSITSEFNMAPNTIKCKVDIPEQVYEFENRFKRPDVRWNRGAQYMDDLQSHNWIEFFHRWHGFASYQELYDDVLEYFALIGVPFGSIQVHGLDPIYIKKPSEERYGNLFLQLRSDRDKDLYDRYENDMGPIEQPEFDFDNSDFNSFVEIYESLKDGYKYSRPHTVGVSSLMTVCG